VHAALTAARVLVPVVALATGRTVAASGLPAETGAQTAVVTLRGSDGTSALPVFSGVASLRMWREDARPVPVPGRDACRAALQEGCAALVLDVAGPVRIAVPGEVVHALAEGYSPVSGAPGVSARPLGTRPVVRPVAPPDELAAALRAALAGPLAGEPVQAVWLVEVAPDATAPPASAPADELRPAGESGPAEPELALGVVLTPGTAPARLGGLARNLVHALAQPTDPSGADAPAPPASALSRGLGLLALDEVGRAAVADSPALWRRPPAGGPARRSGAAGQ